jgi:hypothetical protein
VDMVAPHAARVWRDSRELHVEAEVVVAGGALKTFAAGHAGLDGDAVAFLEMCDL